MNELKEKIVLINKYLAKKAESIFCNFSPKGLARLAEGFNPVRDWESYLITIRHPQHTHTQGGDKDGKSSA